MSYYHGLKQGDVIYNNELCEIFKCSPQGGMRRSLTTNTLILISSPRNTYNDRWIDKIFHYTGMGLTGNQEINYSQNKTLANSTLNTIVVLLFEVFIPKEYTFIGQVELAGEPYQEEQLDQKNNLRKVWIFPLKLKGNSSPLILPETFFNSIEEEKERYAQKISNEELSTSVKISNRNPGTRPVATNRYERNPYVCEYAKRRANGICQLCETPAPFKDKNNNPYLESHHIVWLSKGGEDSIENTVALCPNCHRKMHALNLKFDRQKLKNKINLF